MICARCRKTSAAGEESKCSCESKVSCAGGGDLLEPNDLGDPGDPSAGYQWTCALCRHPAGNVDPPSRVVTTVNSISEKFELVNKVQLPRLSSDLSYIRSTTEKIVKQNENILRSIDELKSAERKNRSSREYRKRKFTLAPRSKLQETDGDSADRMTRHRPRRAIALQELLLVLNRKLHQSSAGSKQQ